MNESLGFYGELRRRCLRTHHNGIYTGMLLADTLWPHLHEINTQASQMEERLIRQMKAAEGIRPNGMGQTHERYPPTGQRDRPE